MKLERNKDVYVGTEYYRVVGEEQKEGVHYYILENGECIAEPYQDLWNVVGIYEAINIRCDISEICGEMYVWEQGVEKGMALLKETLASQIDKKMQQFQSMKERIQIGK